MKVFIQDNEGDHNFESDQVLSKPTEFIQGIRQQGGYYVASRKRIPAYDGNPATEVVDGIIFIPWHKIHLIRFTEVDGK